MFFESKPKEVKVTFWQALFFRVTVKRALKVAVIVGTILIMINQADVILAGSFPPLWKVILTFMVPYSVSSYSSAAFLTDLCRKNPNTSIQELIA
ncbi:MAG: nitrate/nitrite transporter NrtS [Henriciella sp.]|nr:nitrate/nitrite transporter NrtS [Henriciella sp.]